MKHVTHHPQIWESCHGREIKMKHQWAFTKQNPNFYYFHLFCLLGKTYFQKASSFNPFSAKECVLLLQFRGRKECLVEGFGQPEMLVFSNFASPELAWNMPELKQDIPRSLTVSQAERKHFVKGIEWLHRDSKNVENSHNQYTEQL